MSAPVVVALILLVLALLALSTYADPEFDVRRERRRMRVLFALVAVLALLGLSGCATAPNVPRQVIVTVEKFKPLPAWATDPLAKPEAADGSVGARVRSEAERGITIDLANCHRLLLKKLDAGETVDPKACAQP